MNELALIVHDLGIYSQGVLEPAGADSTWDCLRFAPGLVGGERIPGAGDLRRSVQLIRARAALDAAARRRRLPGAAPVGWIA